MPFSPEPPRFIETLTRAHRTAQELIGRTIVETTGKDFVGLQTPPPLKFVAQAYCRTMAFHLTAAAQARQEAAAEQEANARGGHAAEILSPEGEHLGYTIYEEPKTPLIV